MTKGSAIAFLPLVALGSWHLFGKPSGFDSREVEIAKELTIKALKSPATAKFISSKVLLRENEYRMVQILVDSQNGFGALVRDSLCVTFRMPKDGGYTWSRNNYAQECSNPPLEAELDAIKHNNHWGQPVGKIEPDAALQ